MLSPIMNAASPPASKSDDEEDRAILELLHTASDEELQATDEVIVDAEPSGHQLSFDEPQLHEDSFIRYEP